MEVERTSIIVVTDDSSQIGRSEIGSLLRALARQDFQAGEVETLVVETRARSVRQSSRGTPLPAADAERIRLRFFEAPGVGRAEGRNLAYDASGGALVIYLGDDFVPQPGWLQAHRALHRSRPEREVVGIGPAFFAAEQRADPFLAWMEDSGHLFGASFTTEEPLPPNFFFGSNTSLKREFLELAGPFDEEFPFHTTDDWEMGIRLHALGMKAVFLRDARCVHDHEFDLAARCRALYQAGLSGALYDEKSPGGFSVPGFCTKSAAAHRQRAWLQKLLWRLTLSSAAREAHWIESCAAAYMNGYETYQREGRIAEGEAGPRY